MKLHHPEQGNDEIFLGNIMYKDYALCAWRSKRLGCWAYNEDGDLIKSTMYTYFPIFIKCLEVEDKIRSTKDSFLVSVFQEMLDTGCVLSKT